MAGSSPRSRRGGGDGGCRGWKYSLAWRISVLGWTELLTQPLTQRVPIFTTGLDAGVTPYDIFPPVEVTPMRATTQARRPEETAEPLLDADERERTLRALDALLEGDEAEQQETFVFLKESLDQDPPSNRKLFSF